MAYQTLIIINPHSGHRRGTLPQKDIERSVDTSVFDYKIILTEYAGHAYELAQNAITSNIEVVIVAGGDGTINEVVNALQNSSIKIGIVPIGSGNGLARELKIPLRVTSAMAIIHRMKTRKIDLIDLGHQVSVNVAGVGFDAHIAHLFNFSKKRGIWTYFKMTIVEYFKYKPQKYTLKYADKQIERTAFLIAFANTRQFGNNAFIAPKAIDNDGLMEVCILKPFPLIQAPILAIRAFTKSIHHSRYYESFRVKKLEITSKNLTIGHADGEVIHLKGKANISMNPSSLELIVP